MSITTTETGFDSITHTFATVSEITNNINKIKPYELCIATDIDAVYYKDNLGNLHHIKDYILPTATASVLGGVKPDGTTTSVDLNGVISTVNRASTSTQIIAGLGLTGGGDLTTDRTLNIVSANDGIVVNADNIQLNTVDNLASTSTTQPLSGNQGNVIKNITDCMAGGEIKGYIEDGGSHLVGEIWLSRNVKGEFKCLVANSDNYIDVTPGAEKWVQIDDKTNSYRLDNLSKITNVTVNQNFINFNFCKMGNTVIVEIRSSSSNIVNGPFTVPIPTGMIPKIKNSTVALANGSDKKCEIYTLVGVSDLKCHASGTGSYLYGQLVYFI